jgi:signal transduction histidine kinase
MLIDRAAFVDESIRQLFINAGLAAGTRLAVSVADTSIAALEIENASNEGINGSSLYSARLSPPLAEIEVEFSAGVFERGPGFGVLAWTAIVLFGLLVGGFLAMYRFAWQQAQLARQQQNFVSAVSHELKTPLTSIRMYGEMLKSGWADEQKKQTYYEYIFDEGERLSRLIDNVLQLARLNKDGPTTMSEPVAISEVLDVIRSKLSTLAERAGFELKFVIEPAASDAVISADVDALTQIFINLIDNAIKFSGEAAAKEIVITARCPDKNNVVLAVRDFGPGIPPVAMKRLFELFYRPDNELTRTTAGTGIGLALVKQLVTAMSGRVDVKNQDPGAEFRPRFSGRGRSDRIPLKTGHGLKSLSEDRRCSRTFR